MKRIIWVGLALSLGGCTVSANSQPPLQQPAQVAAAPVVVPSGQATVAPQPSPTATPISQDPKVALAQWLISQKARWFTTAWCGACRQQASDFGEEAMSLLKENKVLVDCEENASVCADAGVNSYPTWEFGGKLQRSGGYPLAELARMSNYPGAVSAEPSQPPN
jgi:hypothetical protein